MIGNKPDWTQTFPNERSLTRYFYNVDYKGPGWYSTRTETLYIEKVGDNFTVHVWDDPGARFVVLAELAAVISAPIH